MKNKTVISFRLLASVLFINFCLKNENAIAQIAEYSYTVDVSKYGAPIAPISRGQQIEEFNHQFEGGLYAQLINNPSFEELKNPITEWSLIKRGLSSGNLKSQTAAETDMLNNHQKRCIKLSVISVASGPVGLANGGYWGIALRNNTPYKISFWARRGTNFNGTIKVKMESSNGKVYGHSTNFKLTDKWKHFTCTIVTRGIKTTVTANRFVIYASQKGDVYFDVVTAMPPTWKERPNGLRTDLAQKLNALKMKYIQFPGGCTAESSSMDSCWNWKNSIGPLEQRAGSTRQRWSYRNDLYFGLDEYLQLCEDLGAEPVYTTSAGISEGRDNPEWFSICPLHKMKPIIDDILDLIVYCNGSASTYWGRKRAANGHPKSYHLKYIEIGNENAPEWTKTKEDYIPRYKMIHDAVTAKFPGIKFMYNGEGQNDVMSHPDGNTVDYIDEHFYLKDLSEMYNKYDSIDLSAGKICVAEYATSVKGNGGNVLGNFGDALSDAAFMLGCEKNSDRMWWTGYGNYAGFTGHGDFGPCIVWNDGVSSFVTPSYYMQKILFSDNQGSNVLSFNQNVPDTYWSASMDTAAGKKDVLLKVANKSAKSVSVNISLNGAKYANPEGIFTMLTGKLEEENSLIHPDNIVPIKNVFPAAIRFKYLLEPNSINCLRIHIK